VAYWQGLREGEVLGLQWRYIDFQRDTLMVAQALQWNGKAELVEPKTKQSRRAIARHPDAKVALLARKKSWKKPAAKQWADLVFVTSNGTPIRPRNLIREFKAVIERAGLPDLRFHDLRSMVAATLAKFGLDVKSASMFLGHSQVTTMLQIYAR
jgi:integrase